MIPKDPNRTRAFEHKFYVFYGVEHQDRPTHKQHDTSIAKDTQNDHDAAVISDTTTNTTTNRRVTIEDKLSHAIKKPAQSEIWTLWWPGSKVLVFRRQVVEASIDASDVINAPSVDLL
jgi:hypothetical protein